MSTPREPEGQRNGPSVQDRPDQDDTPRSGAAQGEQGQRPNPGTGPGGVPPWQRVGQAPVTSPGPSAQQPPTGDAGPSTPPEQPARPRRPLVTGTAAPKPPGQDAATTRAPIAKLDSDGSVPTDGPAQQPQGEQTTRGRNSLTGKIIDGPTRNIGRSQVPEDLPDLDAIHHPATSPTAVRSAESVPAGHRGPLRAAVQLRRIDPWSTFKVSAVLAIALFLIWMIAIGVLYVILDGMGVWDQINNSFGQLVSSDNTTESSFEITAGTVFGVAAGVGALYVIVFTALTTVGAFIYNMSSDLVGGIEVTLADRD
ncbi:DUF3566 domain-containing protein [uncultured Williamsia sp.]|uniref:DUF3566 domain-containing protein n=1 Tax=uncultured Williamsia sp. TaxID=259311 RepID=UPI0026201C62|nr:DUF3566 domain-containing protein [uncultured Williamsia sp.]